MTAKNFARIELATGEFRILPWDHHQDPNDESLPDPPTAPPSLAGMEVVEVTNGDLGGLTVEQFEAKKKPDLTGGSFQAWLNRAVPPTLAWAGGITPKANGLQVTLEIRGGPANSDYCIFGLPTGHDCELTEGTLDGSGDADVRYNFYGLSEFDLTVVPRDHSDFEPATLHVAVTSSPWT